MHRLPRRPISALTSVARVKQSACHFFFPESDRNVYDTQSRRRRRHVHRAISRAFAQTAHYCFVMRYMCERLLGPCTACVFAFARAHQRVRVCYVRVYSVIKNNACTCTFAVVVVVVGLSVVSRALLVTSNCLCARRPAGQAGAVGISRRRRRRRQRCAMNGGPEMRAPVRHACTHRFREKAHFHKSCYVHFLHVRCARAHTLAQESH